MMKILISFFLIMIVASELVSGVDAIWTSNCEISDTIFLMETRHFGSGRYSELVLVYPTSDDSLRVEAFVDDGRLVENVVSCSYGEKVIREFMRIVDTRDTTAPNTFRVRSRMDGVSYSYVTSDSGNHCHMVVRAHYSLVSRLIHGLYER